MDKDNTSEVQQNSSINSEQHDKEILIEEKKKRFFRGMRLLIIIISILLGSVILFLVYKKYLSPRTQVVHRETDPNTDIQIPIVEQPPIVAEKKIHYKSDNLKLSLEYPKEAVIIDIWETQGQTKKLEIVYSEKDSVNQSSETISEADITNGYIFRISTFTTNIIDLQEVVKVKKEGLKSECPDTAVFSETYKGSLGLGIYKTPTLTFDVKNCGRDYTIHYLKKFGVFYSIEQVYEGDLGYKQLNKATTQEIIESIEFYPENVKPALPYDLYTNEKYKISFQHPKFDPNCCNMPGIKDEFGEKLTVLADGNTYVDKDNFDGIGVYIYQTNNKIGEDFNKFLEKNRKKLTDDYLVVKGSNPNPQEIEINVGTKKGIMFKNYSWRDITYIFVDLSDPERNALKIGENYIMTIAVKNVSGQEFDLKVDEILNTFKFL